MWRALLVFLFFIVLVAAAFLVAGRAKIVGGPTQFAGGRERGGVVPKRTKSEARAIAVLESLLEAPFPTQHPRWLRGLELDGYNEELAVALEFSGPLHTKHLADVESYESYRRRVERDKLKKKLCREKGVTLIVIDMTLPPRHWRNYILSRLYDAKRKFAGRELPYLPAADYIPEQVVEPYER